MFAATVAVYCVDQGGERFAGSSGPVRTHGTRDGCLGEVVVARTKCLEYGVKSHWGGDRR